MTARAVLKYVLIVNPAYMHGIEKKLCIGILGGSTNGQDSNF